MTKFSAVRVGQHFICNGNECLKTSTRTARIIAYNVVFYYKQNDNVKLINTGVV